MPRNVKGHQIANIHLGKQPDHSIGTATLNYFLIHEKYASYNILNDVHFALKKTLVEINRAL